MSSGGALFLIVAAVVVVIAVVAHNWPTSSPTPSAQQQQTIRAKCEEQATKVLKKIHDFKFRRPAHIDYIDAFDVNDKKIGLVVLAQEPKGGRVTLEGPEYARRPDMDLKYLADYNVDMARHSTHTSSKDLLERICKVDPANEWIFRDPQVIKTELVEKFGAK